MRELKYSPFKKRLIYGLEMQEFYKHKTGKKLKSEEMPLATPSPTKLKSPSLKSHRKSLFKEDLKFTEMVGGEYARYDAELISTSFIDFGVFVDILYPLSQHANLEAKIKCKKHKLSHCKVIFRVFDEDEDGVISKDDLINGLNLLYYGTTIDSDTISKMAEKILEECEAYEGDSIHFDGIRV